MKNQTSIYRTKLLAKLHILITQQGVDKEALYSSFGVESATQMSDAELIECVNLLEGKSPRSPYSPKAKTSEFALRQMRSEILSLITKSPKSRTKKSRGLGVPNDWEILNPFIKKLAGKTLNKLSPDEMDHFKLQLFKMRDKGWVWSDRFKERLNEEPQELDCKPIIERHDDFWKKGERIIQNAEIQDSTRCRPQFDLYLNTSLLPS